MTQTCPLCCHETTSSVSIVEVDWLVRLYERWLGVSIRKEFAGRDSISLCSCGTCDLAFFHPPTPGSGSFYGLLSCRTTVYYLLKKEHELARDHVRGAAKLLEIGCGEGAFAPMCGARDYLGLEISDRAIETAKANGIRVLKETVEEHAKSHDGEYDAVCAFQVLEHIADPFSFIDASIRCLKDGGHLVYAVPSADTYVALMANAILNFPPHHLTRWSDACLKQIANLFPVQLVTIAHERLADLHVRAYAAAVAMEAINSYLGRARRLIDVSLTGRLLGKFAAAAGRFIERGLQDPRIRPDGHTVMAVYRKFARSEEVAPAG